MSITVRWEIEDGYAGKSRLQYTEIEEEDIEDCASVAGAIRIIEDIVQEDFEQKVSWCLIPPYDSSVEEWAENILRNRK